MTGVGTSFLFDGRFSVSLSADYARNDVVSKPSAALFSFGTTTLGFGPRSLRLSPGLSILGNLATRAGFLQAKGRAVDVSSSVVRSYWAGGIVSWLHWEALAHGYVFAGVAAFVPFTERRFYTREPYVRVGGTSLVAVDVSVGVALGL